MTQENYERAAEIDYELSQLKPLQEWVNKIPGVYDLYFGTTYCNHEGLKMVVQTYINNRIAELEKEFEEL